MIRTIVCLLVLQGTEAVSAPAADNTHRFAADIELIQPFIPTVHIIRPKFTWTMWGESGALRGDLILGLYIRPHVPHDVVETIDEYMGIVGYRQ